MYLFTFFTLAIFCFLLIGLILINRKEKLKQYKNKKLTDFIFNEAIHKYLGMKDVYFNSELVSKIWGSHINVFEYSIDINDVNIGDISQLKKHFTDFLNNYARKSNLKSYKDNITFYISDIWIFSNMLYVDVAYIFDENTWQYVQDIKKSDNSVTINRKY